MAIPGWPGVHSFTDPASIGGEQLMRLALVRHGDPTTTGGFVIAVTSTMHDEGKKIALFGDEATCGNCKGAFKIVGTGEGVSEGGRVAVIHGDRVLCPCGKNRVIAGGDAGCYMTPTRGGGSEVENGVAATSQPGEQVYDEQVRAVVPGASLEGYPYVIEADDGQVFSGRVDSRGWLPRVVTEGTGDYTVHWGDEALARSVK